MLLTTNLHRALCHQSTVRTCFKKTSDTVSFPGVQAGWESYTKTGGNCRERHGGGAAGQVGGGLIAKSSFSTFYSHSSVQSLSRV